MDINNQNNTPNGAPGMNPVTPVQDHGGKKIGPIIGALIIVVLLVIAALYFWSNRLNKNANSPENTTPVTTGVNTNSAPTTNTAPTGNTAAVMSSSDDVNDLSNDLNATGDVSAGSNF